MEPEQYFAQITVIEEAQQPSLAAPQNEQQSNTSDDKSEQEVSNYERVKAYLIDHPDASARDIAEALVMSPSTAHKWRSRVKEMQEETAEQNCCNRVEPGLFIQALFFFS